MRKVANLLLGKQDVVQLTPAQGFNRLLNLGLRESEILGTPVVKFFAVSAHSHIATQLDVFEDAFHRVAHFCVIVRTGLCVFALL